MNQTAVMTGKYLIGPDVDLLREPVTCRTEGSADVTSFHHLHQVSDDLKWKSNTKTHTHTHIHTHTTLTSLSLTSESLQEFLKTAAKVYFQRRAAVFFFHV